MKLDEMSDRDLAFLEGFVEKCAAMGVDAEALLGITLKEAKEKGEKIKPGELKGPPYEPSSSDEPGEGGRFEALKAKLQKKAMEIKMAKKIRDPGALAASIGRAKYGKKRFQQMAAAGHKKGEALINVNALINVLSKTAQWTSYLPGAGLGRMLHSGMSAIRPSPGGEAKGWSPALHTQYQTAMGRPPVAQPGVPPTEGSLLTKMVRQSRRAGVPGGAIQGAVATGAGLGTGLNTLRNVATATPGSPISAAYNVGLGAVRPIGEAVTNWARSRQAQRSVPKPTLGMSGNMMLRNTGGQDIGTISGWRPAGLK
jgi:hypothetical protein